MMVTVARRRKGNYEAYVNKASSIITLHAEIVIYFSN